MATISIKNKIITGMIVLVALIPLMPITAQAAPESNKWGINDDLGIAAPGWAEQPSYDLAANAGIGWVRYNLYWSNVNTAPGVYDWNVPDQAVSGALKSGLNVYMTILWAPQWATGNQPGYLPWACVNVQSWSFDSTKPGCGNVTPDKTAFVNFVKAAVARYGDRVKYWGFWNEAANPMFWHGSDIVDAIYIPGYEAAKSVNPNIKVVGPDETDGPGLYEFDRVMKRDVAYKVQTGHNFYDIISFHAYGQYDYVDKTLAVIDDNFKPLIDKYAAGRPVWITEAGARSSAATYMQDGQAEKLDQLYAGIKSRTWIDKFFLYRLRGGDSKNLSDNDYSLIFGDTLQTKKAYDAVKNSLGGSSQIIFTNQSPIGYLQPVSSQGVIFGWALDMNHPADAVEIHLYFDGFDNANAIGGIIANKPRADVNAALNVPGNHGYEFAVPDRFKDGKLHVVRAYAIDKDDTTGGSNVMLTDAPQTFTFGSVGGAFTKKVKVDFEGLPTKQVAGMATVLKGSDKSWISTTNFKSDANGEFDLSFTTIPQNVIVKIEVPNFLVKQETFDLNSNVTYQFNSKLKIGDLNGDNIINSIDFSKLNASWLSINHNIDLNYDGIINTIDFSLMNRNWLVQGDL